jgi:hypothetical protein
VPFVSVADIAAVAFYALTVEKLPSTDYRVLGPELLTHDQVWNISIHMNSLANVILACRKTQQGTWPED